MDYRKVQYAYDLQHIEEATSLVANSDELVSPEFAVAQQEYLKALDREIKRLNIPAINIHTFFKD